MHCIEWRQNCAASYAFTYTIIYCISFTAFECTNVIWICGNERDGWIIVVVIILRLLPDCLRIIHASGAEKLVIHGANTPSTENPHASMEAAMTETQNNTTESKQINYRKTVCGKDERSAQQRQHKVPGLIYDRCILTAYFFSPLRWNPFGSWHSPYLGELTIIRQKNLFGWGNSPFEMWSKPRT